jgi:hypothetical protein
MQGHWLAELGSKATSIDLGVTPLLSWICLYLRFFNFKMGAKVIHSSRNCTSNFVLVFRGQRSPYVTQTKLELMGLSVILLLQPPK